MGFIYVLDRTNGDFSRPNLFSQVTWATGIALDGRRAIAAPGSEPTLEGLRVCPGALGTTKLFLPHTSGHEAPFT
jgi:hypothetical protein